MKRILLLLLLIASTAKIYAQSEYTTSVVFPANYQVGDYIEFLRVNPIDAWASGTYEVSISYTRGNIAAAATHVASISHANADIWREAGKIYDNPYIAAGNYSFTVDCNTQYGNPRLRVRAVKVLGVTDAAIGVNIKVRSINSNAGWTALNVTGRETAPVGFLPMTNTWNLYVGHAISPNGANLALAAIENGNVGVGTNNPLTKLDVRGIISAPEIAFRNDDGGDDSDPYRLRKVRSSGNVNWLELQLNDDADESFRIYGNSCEGFGCGPYSNNLYHSFDASGSAFHKGNVGIGKQNPTEKLEVNGKIRAKEIKVELDGWSDFVFAKDYKLRSLADLDKYIKANKHLPEIPSAKEVEAEGVSLGEMNKKLLQKIEELTLYMIEMKKENEGLMERVSKLEDKK